MEALQLLQVSPVQGPCPTTIDEAGENDRPVHLELRGLPDVVLAQHAGLQATYSLAGLADPGADLLVATPCNGPGVVQRKDRQKKEFHDQSDYR